MNIRATDLVLEIGSGNNPNPRSDILCDRYIHDNNQRAGEFAAVIDRPLVVADGYRLPFKDKTFDYVICSHILEHMEDPQKFIKEVMRVGNAGYIEVPSALSERVFGWDFHLWYCEKDGNRLVLRKKQEGEQFNGFFHRLIAQTIWFRRFFEDYDAVWYVRMEWKNRVNMHVVTAPEARWIRELDKKAWKLTQKAKPEFAHDVLFYARWMTRRVKKKIRKEIKRTIWAFNRRLNPGAIIQKLLPRLQCPACRGMLLLDDDAIQCSGCHISYTHEQGIPIFFP